MENNNTALEGVKMMIADGIVTQEAAEKYFPELKKSKDEREQLTEFLWDLIYKGSSFRYKREDFERWKDWLEKQGKSYTKRDIDEAYVEGMAFAKHELEKQGEQKPDDKVEPKFHKGDFVVDKDGHISQITRIDRDFSNITYACRLIENPISLSLYFENEIRLWDIQDAKDGDVLADVYGNVGIYKKHDDFDWTSYCSLGNNGGFQSFEVEHENERTHPATKEQRDNLLKAMADAGWEFDFDKKELKKIDKIEPIDEYEGLTDFERTVADACIGFIGKELGWKQYIKDNADNLLKIAVKKFHAVQDDTTIAINNEEAYKIGFSDGEAHAKEEMTSAWSEEDEKIVAGLNNCIDELEEVNGWRFTYVNDENVELCKIKNWLKFLKDRVGCEANCTTIKQWSREDDQYLLVCKNALAKYQASDKWDAKIISRWLENKLKAPQSTWKPSNMELEVLRLAAEKDGTCLMGLYEQLKKLREE